MRIHAIFGQAFDRAPYQSKLLASVTTDESGRFEHSLDCEPPPFVRRVEVVPPRRATKPGFGMAFENFCRPRQRNARRFQLVPDEPVRAGVLNLEGRPIAGARVEVTSLQTNTEMMKTLRQMEAAMYSDPTSWTGMERTSPQSSSATTDSDGRFEIVGLGRDRLVGLRMTGPQIAVWDVARRHSADKAASNSVEMGSRTPILRLRNSIRREPSVPLEGTVHDEARAVLPSPVRSSQMSLAGEKDLMDSDGLLSTTEQRGRPLQAGRPD